MLASFESGDDASVRKNAESIMNLLAGSQSQDHKDWNKDGELTDASDGYGLLLNGDNLGYIQAVYAEADYAANTPGATQKMIVHGGDVKVCVQNLAQWIPQLQAQVLTILTFRSRHQSRTNRSAMQPTLAEQIINGIDLDGNGKVDPLAGECGIQTAYEYVYYMADMPILPVGVITPTANASGIMTTPTSTSTSSQFFAAPTKTPVGLQQNTLLLNRPLLNLPLHLNLLPRHVPPQSTLPRHSLLLLPLNLLLLPDPRTSQSLRKIPRNQKLRNLSCFNILASSNQQRD